jgi:hypothetical protein
MQIEVSVKKPLRGSCVDQCASAAGSVGPENWCEAYPETD